MTRKRQVVYASIALVVLGIAGAEDAKGSARPLVGYSDEPTSFERHGKASRDSGATGARLVVGWNHDPASIAGAVAALGSARPVITLYTVDDVDLGAYGAQCAAFARAYPRAIIQAGNEPNIHIGGFQPVERVVGQIKACAYAVYAIDPRRTVLGPAIAPVNVDDAVMLAGEDSDYAAYRSADNAQWHRYMERVYEAVPGIGVAMNIYPYGADPIAKYREDLQWGKQFGPVYVTETAMLGDYGPRKAAKLAARSSRWLVQHGARSVLFHRFAWGPVDPVGWRTYAIDRNGKRTALYRALKREWRR